MRVVWLASAFATLVVTTQVLQAQQPDSTASPGHGAKGMMMTQGLQQMGAMDSMNARLDRLVGRMNRATGNTKVTLMAQVINELVTQRKAMQGYMRGMMQEHMRGMMQEHGGMMEMGKESDRTEAPRPKPGMDSAAADTAGHAGHHPQQ